jgi:hypothetical protein
MEERFFNGLSRSSTQVTYTYDSIRKMLGVFFFRFFRHSLNFI